MSHCSCSAPWVPCIPPSQCTLSERAFRKSPSGMVQHLICSMWICPHCPCTAAITSQPCYWRGCRRNHSTVTCLNGQTGLLSPSVDISRVTSENSLGALTSHDRNAFFIGMETSHSHLKDIALRQSAFETFRFIRRSQALERRLSSNYRSVVGLILCLI